MATTFAAHILGPDDHASRPDAATVPYGAFYYCTDHDLLYINNAGTWGTYLDNSAAGGAVATDAIWDAAGDLAVGTGANTAAKLTKGSDGEVLTMVAGAVDWATPAGSGLATDSAVRTAGDVTTNNTGWTDFDNGLDLSVPAIAGDVLGISVAAMCDGQNVGLSFNFEMVTSGNLAVTQTYSPIYAWPSVTTSLNGTLQYTVVSGDISGDNVAVRLQYKSTGAVDRTVLASTSFPVIFSVVNYGQ